MQDAILISLATIASGVFALIIRYSFRSKCENVNLCCGCVKFNRDIRSEKEITTQESIEEIKQT